MLDGLLPLRNDLVSGYKRILYIGWLLEVSRGKVEGNAKEPTVPPGLTQLSPALKKLVNFLLIDQDLLAAAAESSSPIQSSSPDEVHMKSWIAGLPDEVKNDFLLRTVQGDSLVKPERMAQYTKECHALNQHNPSAHRLLDELRQLTKIQAINRREIAEHQEFIDKMQKEKMANEAREKHLDSLEGHEEQIWRQVDELVSARVTKNYGIAINLLKDLKDLAQRTNNTDGFFHRLESLRQDHARKLSFTDRLIEVDGGVERLVASTYQLIEKATSFNERDSNTNFEYDYDGYKTIEHILECILKAGHLKEVMNLSLEPMRAGSAQIEASDEGLMLEVIESCLMVAISGVAQSGLTSREILHWKNQMSQADRVGSICESKLKNLQTKFTRR